MEFLIPLFIQIISAAIGGNIAGNFIKKYSLGLIGNGFLGIHGGGLGGYALGFAGVNIGGTIYGSLIAGLIGGLVGGACLLILLRLLRFAIRDKSILQPAVNCL